MMRNRENSENFLTQALRRWWWLVFLLPLLASAVSFILNKNKPNMYLAEAQMLIGPGLDSSNPDLNSLRTSGFLMQTYKKMASTDNFLQAVLTDIKADLPLDQLRQMIDLNTDSNSLILTIDVQSQDPELAIKIANAVAKELLILSPANPNNPATITLEQNRAQANSLDETIQQSEVKLSTLEAEMQKLDAQAISTNDAQSQALRSADDRVKFLEAEYQKLTSIADQTQMGGQILSELIIHTQARIKYLESHLQATEPDLQTLVLPQIDAENSHLADLQKTLLENQQTIEGQSLDNYILTAQGNIAVYQSKLPNFYDANNRRLLNDQIDAERKRINDAENIAANQRLQIFSRLSEEHGRISDIKNLPISEKLEKRRLLTSQINTESDRLTTLRDSRALLSDTILKSWTNEVQITQLASTTTEVPSNLQLFVVIAFIAGLAVSIAVVLANFYYASSGQNSSSMEAALNAPVLGRILPTNVPNNSPPLMANQLAIQSLAISESEENYRMMVVKLLHRLNSLQAANSDGDSSKKAGRFQDNGSAHFHPVLPQTILISDLYSENKVSEIAAKIAMALAQTGKRVLLVDSTLSEEEIREIFGGDTANGHSISLTSEETPVGLLAVPSLGNLFILPGGPIHSAPFGLFGPSPASDVISVLKKFATYTLIVGPHLMTSSGTFGLASRVDGLILIVPDNGLNGEQLSGLMHNVTTYKWQIVGSVIVSGQSYLQNVLNRWTQFSRRKEKNTTGKPSSPNREQVYVYEKLRNTVKEEPSSQENARPFQEINSVEGES